MVPSKYWLHNPCKPPALKSQHVGLIPSETLANLKTEIAKQAWILVSSRTRKIFFFLCELNMQNYQRRSLPFISVFLNSALGVFLFVFADSWRPCKRSWTPWRDARPALPPRCCPSLLCIESGLPGCDFCRLQQLSLYTFHSLWLLRRIAVQGGRGEELPGSHVGPASRQLWKTQTRAPPRFWLLLFAGLFIWRPLVASSRQSHAAWARFREQSPAARCFMPFPLD